MMNAQHWNFQREAKGGRNTCAHQQCSCQPRSLSVGDGAEIPQFESGFTESATDERQHPPYMVPGGQFRDHTAILPMHFGLGIKRVTQQAALRVVKRYASFIARSFNAKYEQGRVMEE